MKSLNLLFTSLIIASSAFAEQSDSMDELLDTYVHNSDLSKKTKLENAGNVTIITREELDRMQARNLRDVMKSLPLLNYVENRWGFTDPVYVTHTMPFNSNGIRIYIDNQEVTSASYGSGLFYFGDIDIGFVDHIEVYALNPSFEHSTEPARHLIKLYSKVAQRDKGSKVELSVGSRGANQQSYQYADIVDGTSYFTYVSRMDDRRTKHHSEDIPMSRDQERYYFLSTISRPGHQVQVQAIKSNRDMFMGISLDGRTHKAEQETDYLHVGYENTTIENLKLSAVWEHGTSANHFINDFEELKLTNGDDIFTVDAQYKWSKWKNNELIMGAKYRHKYFTVDEMEYNGFELPKLGYDTQVISSVYMEDHYTLNENWLLTLGAQLSHVYNNDEVENQNVWLARAGVIYSDENWVFKTFLHYSEFLIEPFYYTTAFTSVQGVDEPESVSNITQEIQYKKDKNKVRVVVGYDYLENTLINFGGGQVLNKDDSESKLFAYVEYSHKFDIHNTLSTNFSYIHSRNLYRREVAEGFDEYQVMVRLLNRYGNFDIFNELLYNRNSFIEEDYLDYSAGVKYKYSDQVTFSLKGENIFDKAREDLFRRSIPNIETGDWKSVEPLYISPIDQRIYLTVEYLF